MNKEEFNKLKNDFVTEVTITPENVMKKSLEIPVIHSRYLNIYIKEKRELKNINTNMEALIGKLHHHYKHNTKFIVNSITEVDRYIHSDDEYIKIKLTYDKQSLIVEYLEERLQLLKRIGFGITNYINLKKIEHGIET